MESIVTLGIKETEMTTRKKGTWLFVLFLALMVAPGLIYLGCSDSSTSSLTPSMAGYEVPAEISAVPPSEGATGHLAAVSNLSLRGRLSSLVSAATDPGTDYSQVTTRKYVEEHTLEQFEILEDVLNAIDQTHYADAGNINNGPYKCIVAWEEEDNGVDIKRLEPWVVDSQQLVEKGQVVLRVRAWIEEEDEEGTELVKAELKIYSPATRRADGSY